MCIKKEVVVTFLKNHFCSPIYVGCCIVGGWEVGYLGYSRVIGIFSKAKVFLVWALG